MNTKQFIKFLESKFRKYPGGIRYGYSHGEGNCFFYEDVIEVLRKESWIKNPYLQDFLISFSNHFNFRKPYCLLMADGYYHRCYLWDDLIRFVNVEYPKIIELHKRNKKELDRILGGH